MIHAAMDIITEYLKKAAAMGMKMADGYGNVHIVHTPIITYSRGLVEHLCMATVRPSTSPISLTTSKEFSDNAAVFALHTKKHMQMKSHKVSCHCDPWHIYDFVKECKVRNLNSVHLPFWHNFLLTELYLMCSPDLLHFNYKYFYDHRLKAVQIVVSPTELNHRFTARHHHIGYTNLHQVSEVKQMTRMMHRELMCTTIIVMEGTVSARFMHAMVDFLLMAQYPWHTPASLAHMQGHLQMFHNHKDAIVQAGGCSTLEHWHIPKLELMNHFVFVILSHGTLPQWSCNTI